MSQRVDSFHEGQVWESPRGFIYKVICIENGQALLRLGETGKGKPIRRKWDAVTNWALIQDKQSFNPQ